MRISKIVVNTYALMKNFNDTL